MPAMAWCMGAAYTAFEGAFEELFDIVDRIDTLSPENPNLHREVHFGGKEPPQSLLSESVAKHLDKLHQFPDRLLLRMWMVPSQTRRAICSLFGPCPASKGCLLPARPLPSVVLA